MGITRSWVIMFATSSFMLRWNNTYRVLSEQVKRKTLFIVNLYGLTLTRTQTFVLLVAVKSSGKQLLTFSNNCLTGSEGSRSIEGKWSKEGKQVHSSARSLCRSAIFSTSGKCGKECISITCGTLIAVYIVRARKRMNPIKCLWNKIEKESFISNAYIQKHRLTSKHWASRCE